MISLLNRSYKKELLDNDDIPFADIKQNMSELNTINTLLGGHNISIDGIKKIVKKGGIKETISICEIGCGGGDNLKAIDNWCLNNKIKVTFIGIDIKQECLQFAQQQYPNLNVKWITSDYTTIEFKNDKPDIIFSSLFCHHFTDQQIISMLKWMTENSKKGFFINDLHRHFLAYNLIKIITRLFSKSYLVKNDAPLSVARGFKLKEWQHLIQSAKIFNVSIQWKWAFRYLIIYCKPSLI